MGERATIHGKRKQDLQEVRLKDRGFYAYCPPLSASSVGGSENKAS